MISAIKIDLEDIWTWGCTSSYTAVVGVAQLQNVKRLKTKTLPTRGNLAAYTTSRAAVCVNDSGWTKAGFEWCTDADE